MAGALSISHSLSGVRVTARRARLLLIGANDPCRRSRAARLLIAMRLSQTGATGKAAWDAHMAQSLRFGEAPALPAGIFTNYQKSSLSSPAVRALRETLSENGQLCSVS
jgi:hypothetical protein